VKELMDHVYRKSDKGLSELATRSGALDAKARAALILVNGRDPLSVLQQRIGADIVPLIEQLRNAGYIERVDAVPEMPPPHTPSAAPVATLSSDAMSHRLEGLKRAAIARLTPHFGPDVNVVGHPLLAAMDYETYAAALAVVESKLAIYVGKKQAAKIVSDFRP
jgi:hypothetical protein